MYADIIRLETSTNRVRLTPTPILHCRYRKVYGVKSTSWCTGAYIISRQTAAKLLALPSKFHRPSDVFLYNFNDPFIAPDLEILQFNPAPCTQDKYIEDSAESFTSNIESSISSTADSMIYLKKLSPTVLVRGLYRSLAGYKRIKFM